jgi:large subunit ribosomal protein L31e
MNLGRAWITPRYRRTDRVINMIREFAKKSMKSEEVKLDQDLNRLIWRRGKANPPRRVRLKLVKDEDGTVVVSMFEQGPVDEYPSTGTHDEDTEIQEPKDSDVSLGDTK